MLENDGKSLKKYAGKNAGKMLEKTLQNLEKPESALVPTLALGTFLHCSALLSLVHFNILPFFVTHSSTAPCQACSDHCFLSRALILQCSALKYCLLLNVEHFSGVRCSCGAHKAGGAGARSWRGLATGPYKVNHFCQQAKLFQIIAVNQDFIANYSGKILAELF